MQNPSLTLAHKLILIVSSCIAFITSSQAVTIPRFDLPSGESVIITNNYIHNERGRRTKEEQMVKHSESVWVRYWAHIPEEKRITEHDEWSLLIPMSKTTSEPRANPKKAYKDDKLHKVMVRYYFNDDQIIIEPIDETKTSTLTEEQKKSITSIATGNSYFESIVSLISTRDYPLNKDIELETELVSKYLFGFKGTIKLNAVRLMWEKEVVEFVANTTYKAGKTLGHCKYTFWVIKENGRPVNFTAECNADTQSDDIKYHRTEYISRAYSYPQYPISTISPRPLPALQPSGEIKGMKFSDELGQLIFLTEERGTNTSWLTFWDLNQRKTLNTIEAVGDKLLLSDNEKVINVLSQDSRLMKSWLKLSRKYQTFGGVNNIDLDTDRKIKSSDIIGLYPITLNNQYEIEIWNPGYNTLSRKKLKHSTPVLLSIAPDGRMVTIDNQNKLYIHHISIDTDGCKTDFNTSYCNQVNVELDESDKPIQIETNIQKLHLNKDKATIKKIQIHPDEPVVAYCSNSPAVCGIVNYKTNTNYHLPYTSNVDFIEDKKVLTDIGTYDLTGNPIDQHEFRLAYMPGSSVSKKHNLIFNQDYREEHITDRKIIIRDKDNGKTIDTIKRKTFPINNITKESEKNIIFTTGSYNNPKTYVLDLDQLQVTDLPLEVPVKKINISSSGWVIAELNGFSFLFNTADPQSNIPLEFKINDYVFLEKYFIYARDNKIFQINLNNKKTRELYQFDSNVHEIEVFDETGIQLVARLNKGIFSLPHNNKTLDLPYYNASAKNSILFDRNSNTFFVSGLRGNTPYFNANIEVIQQFSIMGDEINEMMPIWADNNVIASSENGELWSGTSSGKIIIRDISSGLIKEEIYAHDGKITNILSLNKNTMVTAATDGTIKLWRLDITNGMFKHSEQGNLYQFYIENDIGKRQPKLISTVTVDINGEFIINSPDGYYWSTPKALHQSSFLNGDEIFDYTQYDFWLNRPDIILERLGTGDETSRNLWRKMVAFRKARHPNKPEVIPTNQNAPEFSLSGPDNTINQGKIKLTYSLNNIPANAEDNSILHILVNQIPVYGTQGKNINKSEGTIDLSLTPGINKIKAYVVNTQGMQSESQFLTYNMPETEIKPDLYVLTIGVSDYINDELDLNYASKDANDIKQLFSNSTQFNKITTKRILDKDVTVDTIIKAKNFLMKSKPSDNVIVFFAGHGFLDKEDNYYFGTTDIDPFSPQKNGLPYSQVTSLLDGIPSRKKLLMLDTCHSGEVTQVASNTNLPEGVKARGIKRQKSQRKNRDLNVSFELLQKSFVDLRSSTGTIVISAAGGQEYAFERSNIKNGVFTATVIKALRDKAADTDKDGNVSISELRNYTYNEVSRLTNGKQKPTTRNNNLDQDFSIY
ncbi:MAG: hypothetical protein DIZ80_08160 [endosymbiont of Galathealinum brachiosum]|uniref:Peptidase C14 caspase domain-containing protein n=1 Tax=endosymbiont of Galathealinum brachiosum TaxID=2200906 RepID=A0A370DIW0_9GAMM|nr:MAG: hypothetical protein DIZ80_08160 [endosymbiont of Galathealinum brachiosum]